MGVAVTGHVGVPVMMRVFMFMLVLVAVPCAVGMNVFMAVSGIAAFEPHALGAVVAACAFEQALHVLGLAQRLQVLEYLA
jgi:hypothetical protein